MKIILNRKEIYKCKIPPIWNKFIDCIDWLPFMKDKIIVEPQDVWDADYTMARIISPILKEFKKNSRLVGHIEDSDVPEELRVGDVEDEDLMEKEKRKYIWVLDEIIWAMEQISSSEKDMPKYDKENETESLRRIEEYKDRIQRGCELFGKYFQTFWD